MPGLELGPEHGPAEGLWEASSGRGVGQKTDPGHYDRIHGRSKLREPEGARKRLLPAPGRLFRGLTEARA